jgi:hypothetical protein
MLQTFEGIYENGQVIFNEIPLKKEKMKVLITFTDEKVEKVNLQERKFGTMKGTFKMSDDFNDDISDLFDVIKS